MTSRPRVFIARQRTEASFVQRLEVELLRSAVDWRFNEVIPYVRGWETLAEDAIRESAAFVFIATTSSLDSGPCQFEWRTAVSLGKPILRIDIGQRIDQAVIKLFPDCPRITFDGDISVCAASLIHWLNQLPSAQRAF